jgi:23S rRNA (cytosine1962-C5)-methyltransferase
MNNAPSTVSKAQFKAIHLKKGKEIPVKRFHPWIFSGAIYKQEGKPIDGDLVEVLDYQQNFLAIGHFYSGSIAVKIFSFEKLEINADFWKNKLKSAYDLRILLALENTNCYRLVHGEGDGFPGLIIDFYNGVAVYQAHTIGMHQEKELIVAALKSIYGKKLIAVYDKSAETLPKLYAEKVQNGYLFGEVNLPHLVEENGVKFKINWQTGQKTGFFLDQRDNRKLLQKFVSGKRVLNAFSYSGGFSAYALLADAKEVYSVDSSEKATLLATDNIELNVPKSKKSKVVTSDVIDFLKQTESQFEVIILDPPAYAKSMDARHRALQAYKRLNIEGLKKLKSGGVLFTFSCSQVVDRELFYNTIVAAALESSRQVRVLHHLSQGADHPVNAFHPEGNYLKGLVLYVD